MIRHSSCRVTARVLLWISPALAGTRVAWADSQNIPTDSQSVPTDTPTDTPNVPSDTPTDTPTDTPNVPTETPTFPLAAPVIPSAAAASILAGASSVPVQILSPKSQAVLASASTEVTVQAPLGCQMALRVNGEPVSATQIGRTETDTTAGTVTQTWYGVTLQNGENTLAVRARAGDGVAWSDWQEVRVLVPHQLAQLTLAAPKAQVPADGHSIITLLGDLQDEYGHPYSRDLMVNLTATAGTFAGRSAGPTAADFQVLARGGHFTAILRAGHQAGNVTVHAAAAGLEASTQVMFLTDFTPSLIAGVLDVRLGAKGAGPEGDSWPELSFDQSSPSSTVAASGFATGKVDGWMLNGAYNSSHPLNQNPNGTTGLDLDTQARDQTYPMYGDASTRERKVNSSDKLYVRLERNQDSLLWGNYDTAEFATRSQQFSAITRQFHALKANFQSGSTQFTGFYGDNVHGFQRDAISPDGTSGLYFLSHRPVIVGSENVSVELERLDQPGTVVDRQRLVRGTDYEVDYDRGTLLFHRPVLRTDSGPEGEILVRHIITTYEYDKPGSVASAFGGRLMHPFTTAAGHDNSWGMTYLRQSQGLRSFSLLGADSWISLGRTGHLVVEYARSTNVSEALPTVSGEAFRVEAQQATPQGAKTRLYWQSARTGFANDATISFVPGQSRYGAQWAAPLSAATTFRAQIDREENRGTAPQPAVLPDGTVLSHGTALSGGAATPAAGVPVDNSLTTYSAGLIQRLGTSSSLAVEWIGRHRTDKLSPDTLGGDSSQLQTRLTAPLSRTVTLEALNSTTLSSHADAVLGDSSSVRVNWAVLPGLGVGVVQQWLTHGQNSGKSVTRLDVLGGGKFGPATDFQTRCSLLTSGSAISTQEAIGLNHRWIAAPGLKITLSYEHILGGLFNQTAAGPQFPQPSASGQTASSLGLSGGDSHSLSLDYIGKAGFKAAARYENRTSAGGSNTVVTADLSGKIIIPLTGLLHLERTDSSNQGLGGLGPSVTLRLGLAYRDPRSDKWNLLARYEYRQNPSTVPDTLLLGSGTGSTSQTLALETIYAPDWRWEVYTKYALRRSVTHLAGDFVGSSLISLFQARALYRVGYRIDLVGELRGTSQATAGYRRSGAALEAGYHLNPDLRLAAGYHWGRLSDDDFSGSRFSGGFYLNLTAKVNQLFGGFGAQNAAASPTKTRAGQ